jgi:hypothetical protein
MTGAIDRIVDSKPRDLIDLPIVRRRIATGTLHQVEVNALEDPDG